MALRARRDRGIALLLALLVLVILAVVVVQMSVSSLHTKTVAENHVADLQNSSGVKAGYYQALLFLQSKIEDGGTVDSLGERWAQPIEFDLGKAHVSVTIQDSTRFVSLSQLVDDKGEANAVVVSQLKRLVQLLGHPPDIADRIIDYVDADSKGAYEARAKNERLYNLEELLRIEGITPEVVYGGNDKKGLVPFVTAWPITLPQGSAPGMVNPNTAPLEVLQSLADEMTVQTAGAIVAWRSLPGADGRPQVFQKPDDVKKVPGMNDTLFNAISNQLTVNSQTFEIRVRSKVGNLEKAWLYVVSRSSGSQGSQGTQGTQANQGSQGGGLTLLASQRMNDFLSVKPSEEKP